MNLSKIEKEIKIDEENYILTFDMKSILTYKEMSGKTFTQGIGDLLLGDDEEVIYFIGSMLRRKETPNTPISEEVYEFNLIACLVELKNDVIKIVIDSLPQDDNSKKK